MSIAEKLITVAENIPKVYNAGYLKGKTENDDNYYDVFWDNYQDFGNRTDYANQSTGSGFSGIGWNDITFKPKYDITPTQAYSMFSGSRITDLSALDVVLDFSNCSDIRNCFRNSTVQHIGIVNAYIVGYGWMQDAFNGCRQLKTIDKLIMPATDTLTGYSGLFTNCTALEDITIEGEIKKSISFAKSSLLSENSIESIIESLANLAELGLDAQTLTFDATVKAKLTDEQISTITSKNWNLA